MMGKLLRSFEWERCDQMNILVTSFWLIKVSTAVTGARVEASVLSLKAWAS
jgi:hypothetical protein